MQFQELKAALYGSKWWLYVIAALIILIRPFVASYRWHIILGISKIRVSLLRLFYWYMIASFFNMFLPTALGGDVVRIYELASYSSQKADAAASVLMERILGFMAMIGMAVVALFISTQARQNPTIYMGVLAVSVVYILFLIALFHHTFCLAIINLFKRIGLIGIRDKLRHGYTALYSLQNHHRSLGLAFVASVIFQIIAIICIYLVGSSLHINVPISYYFLSVPIIWLLTMLPISINGMGVREGGFVLFFTAAGISHTNALLLSFLSFSLLIIMSLIGGIFYMMYPWFYKSNRNIDGKSVQKA